MQSRKKHFKFSSSDTHTFTFNLLTENLNLGEFYIYRDTAFSQQEITFLEIELCILIYPLKNAVTLYQTLNAALQDSLTSLLSRASFNSTLQREMKLAERNKTDLSVLIDIDNFKSINDNLGHLQVMRSSVMLRVWSNKPLEKLILLIELAAKSFNTVE